ncbi:nitrate- and nitrite sensing domain-containing protein [Actinomadura nitritigenes]|uniref:nitrate- and nitrite sensing domain-containing protein n=1 Tax=Actinomadura nitritigenes TaxID=134602 RepID=UPI003D8F7D59
MSPTSSLKAWGALRGPVAQRLRMLDASFGGLPRLRARIGSGTTTPLQAMKGYDDAVDNTVRLLTTLASVDDIGVYQQTVSLLDVYWSYDFMLREDLLLSAARFGVLDGADRSAFAEWAGIRAHLLAFGTQGVEQDIVAVLQQLTGQVGLQHVPGDGDRCCPARIRPRRTDLASRYERAVPGVGSCFATGRRRAAPETRGAH